MLVGCDHDLRIAPLLGTTTAGAYVESATGIEGGRAHGLHRLGYRILFSAGAVFLAVCRRHPPQAYGPALIIVGLFMLAPITRVHFTDYTESIPAFAVVSPDGVYVQHRHWHLRGIRAVSHLQAGCGKSEPTETWPVGVDRLFAAVLRLLSV